jgi:hypothetical protein
MQGQGPTEEAEASSDDNGELSNTASVPPLPLSRKRLRGMWESSNDAHPPRNENGPGNKTTTGSAEFVVDLKLAADEVEVSPHKKRCGVMKGQRSAKNITAGNCAQNLKESHTTKKGVGSGDAQVADHRESHEGITAAAAAAASRLQSRVSAWDDRLSELVDYRKIHGHCNVPTSYKENTKLAMWVSNQRTQYRLHLEGNISQAITTVRIQALEGLGFKWNGNGAAWEDRLSELAKYRKIHGHCNVPKSYSEKSKLATWVVTQRKQYKLHREGKASHMTLSRIQELESLAFEWCRYGVTRVATSWKDRLSELADYRKIHGHCNVPMRFSDNSKLGN